MLLWLHAYDTTACSFLHNKSVSAGRDRQHLRLREVAFIHVLANGIHDNHCALGDVIASQYHILLCLPHLHEICQLPDEIFDEGMSLEYLSRKKLIKGIR